MPELSSVIKSLSEEIERSKLLSSKIKAKHIGSLKDAEKLVKELQGTLDQCMGNLHLSLEEAIYWAKRMNSKMDELLK
jgi:hypothetical protein